MTRSPRGLLRLLLPLACAGLACAAAPAAAAPSTCGPPVPHCMQGGALYGFGYDDAESKSAAACCAAAAAWRSSGAQAWELEARVPATHAPECKIYTNFSVANNSGLNCTAGKLLPAAVAKTDDGQAKTVRPYSGCRPR